MEDIFLGGVTQLERMGVVTRFDQVAALEVIRGIPPPDRVLMVPPDHFQVEYVINPHMEGQIGKVDPVAARSQWDRLGQVYSELGFEPGIIDPIEGLPDMVFCANQTLPFPDLGHGPGVIRSKMHSDYREREVETFDRFFRTMDHQVIALEDPAIRDFEGTGDGLFHPGQKLIWGGYGFRSSLEAFEEISARLEVAVIALELVDESFYHLDTCLALLDETSAVWYPPAFSDDGRSIIESQFETLIASPRLEAENYLASNCHCPDGKTVIIQNGCPETVEGVVDAGFEVIEVATDEYLKSGGSVFCMKLMWWS